MTRLFVGTSGYQYGHWNKGVFYPPHIRDQLAYISSKLNVIEFNTSFYSIPKPDTVSNWVARIDNDCRMILKAPQSFTHHRLMMLINPKSDKRSGQSLLDWFVEGVHRIPQKKRGPVLVQTPARLHFALNRLRDCLEYFHTQGLRVAFEPRHASWLRSNTYKLLEQYGAALVAADFSGIKIPVLRTADFLYIRRHGPTGHYDGCYTDFELEAILNIAMSQNATEAYILFNNDGHGYAPKNAMSLLAISRGSE